MHKYQKIIDEIKEAGGNATNSTSAYKLLFKLAKIHNIDMNGSKFNICKEFGISKNQVISIAKDALNYYIATGSLYIPNEFKFRRRKLYFHDGDEKANRNLWQQNKKIYTNIKRKNNLPSYPLNTVKK